LIYNRKKLKNNLKKQLTRGKRNGIIGNVVEIREKGKSEAKQARKKLEKRIKNLKKQRKSIDRQKYICYTKCPTKKVGRIRTLKIEQCFLDPF